MIYVALFCEVSGCRRERTGAGAGAATSAGSAVAGRFADAGLTVVSGAVGYVSMLIAEGRAGLVATCDGAGP